MSGSDVRLAALGELGRRIAGAAGLEAVIDVALLGLDELLGYRHSLLLVHQPETDLLVTLASRGYDSGGIGSEVALGQGVIGMAGQRRGTMRIGNLQRMLAYALAVQRTSGASTDPEIRLPGLASARSQMAAPMVARGDLVGVLAVETEAALAFDEDDEKALAVAAHLVGATLDRERVAFTESEEMTLAVLDPPAVAPSAPAASMVAPVAATPVRVRHYAVDGSVFVDDLYLIKGVAGRLLWKVLSEHQATGRTAFTNREARLDPALELPAFRDNFESRLILLKRRLEERGAPLRISGAGRGCFELTVDGPLSLEHMA